MHTGSVPSKRPSPNHDYIPLPFCLCEGVVPRDDVCLPGMLKCGEQATLFQWLPCLCDCETVAHCPLP